MARSLTPCGFDASGACRRSSTSPTVRNLGSESQVEGVVSREEGSFLRKPLRTENRKKERRAEMSRASERAESPAPLSRGTKATRVSSETRFKEILPALRKPM